MVKHTDASADLTKKLNCTMSELETLAPCLPYRDAALVDYKSVRNVKPEFQSPVLYDQRRQRRSANSFVLLRYR